MRLTVLGGCGAWPTADQACSGYLVEHDGFRLLIDPGYAVLPRLLRTVGSDRIDAVYVSHGHPDHCADLNPLLRARALGDGLPGGDRPAPLTVHAPPGALDAVLALDRPGMLDDAYRLHTFAIGSGFEIGPFRADTGLLPHWVPNAALRLTANGRALAYTGDGGHCIELVDLARGADLLLAEATYVDLVPDDSTGYLTSARQAGEQASRAGVGRLTLTHLWPGTDPRAARSAAALGYAGPIDVAAPDLTADLS